MSLKTKLLSLLDKIDALLENNKKIRHELLLMINEESKPTIEDILGIKVYLGSDYKYEERSFTIGEEIPDPFAGCNGPPEFTNVEVSGSVVLQDCAGNILTPQ